MEPTLAVQLIHHQSEDILAKTKRRRTKASRKRKQTISPLMIGLVSLVAIVVVGGLSWAGESLNSGGSLDIDQFPAKGDPAAPVTLVEYSDYG
jgi:hypothetical protein